MGWYDRNTSHQAHEGNEKIMQDKAVANTMKPYDRINGQKAHGHEEERQDVGLTGYGDKGFRLDNT